MYEGFDQKKYRAFKSALTRAINSKGTAKILTACDAFDAYYNRPGAEPMPDDWHRWQRARDDASYQNARSGASW